MAHTDQGGVVRAQRFATAVDASSRAFRKTVIEEQSKFPFLRGSQTSHARERSRLAFGPAGERPIVTSCRTLSESPASVMRDQTEHLPATSSAMSGFETIENEALGGPPLLRG